MTSVKFEEIAVRHEENYRYKPVDRASSDIAGLAHDIEESGLLEPLVCRKAGREYTLLDGFRRYAAIELIRAKDPAAFSTVPISCWSGSDEEALFVRLSANLLTKAPSPVDIGIALTRLRNCGVSVKTLAARYGKSVSWVYQHGSLIEDGAAELLDRVHAGHVSLQEAIQLIKAEPEEQKEAAKKLEELSRHDSATTADLPSAGIQQSALPEKKTRKGNQVKRKEIVEHATGPKKIRPKIQDLRGTFMAYSKIERPSQYLEGVLDCLRWIEGNLPAEDFRVRIYASNQDN